jgi:molybdate transport system substrate-binding protein
MRGTSASNDPRGHAAGARVSACKGPGERRAIVAALVALALALAACGGSKSSGSANSGSSNAGRPDLTVSAAASLQPAFSAYAQQFSQAAVRYSFAGSDVLAAQIEQGIRPDVFASANTKLPDMLYAKGLVSKPVTFAANKLVIAVRAGSTKVRSLSDLERPGVTVAVGSLTVPIGDYTRKVLAKLGPGPSAKILANVRSEEPDVNGIVGKLTQGDVDAGFTYITDVRATKGALTAIPLPASLQPVVAYGVAIVKGGAHPAQARAFIAGLMGGSGRADLLHAGFLPPPAQ